MNLKRFFGGLLTILGIVSLILPQLYLREHLVEQEMLSR